MKKLFLFAIVVLGFTAVSFGQAQTTLSNNASATIITTLEIEHSNGTDLNFGTIGSPKNAAIVTMTPAGARSGNADLVGNDGATPEFTVNGELNTNVTVILPTSVNLTGAGTTMTVTNWTSDAVSLTNVSLGASGQLKFKVGADLNINAEQDPDEYVGTYDITVAYN